MQPYPNPNYYAQYMPGQYMQHQQYTPQPSYTPQPAAAPQLSRIVNDFTEITVGDIPTNGTASYFIKSDGSEIQSRRWSEDGRVITARYVPDQQEPQENPLDLIMKRLDAIEEKITTPKTTRRKADDE